MATAIIGMARSGTSLVSRLLSLTGVYLGEEGDFREAGPENPRGFWEHQEIMRLNDALLAHFAGAWDYPPEFPARWAQSKTLDPLRDEARMLLGQFRERPCWGWKDVRTTLTLPFWRPLIAELDGPDPASLRMVVCVRNPLDVAASLSSPARIPLDRALALWQYYTEQAFLHTRPEERVVVIYEQVLQDYRTALAPALGLLGLPPVRTGSARDQAMQEYIDGSLRHHQHSLDDVLANPEVPADTKQLYQALLSGPQATARFLGEGSCVDREAALLHQFLQWRVHDLQTEVDGLRTMLQSPPHRAVSVIGQKIRQFPRLYQLTTSFLRGAGQRRKAA